MVYEKGTHVSYVNSHGSITHNCIVVEYDAKNERYVLENTKGKQIYIDADSILKEEVNE